MSKGTGIKTTAIALLMCAVFFPGLLLGSGTHGLPLWVTGIALVFGIVNVLFALPGAHPLRIIAFTSAMAFLLWPRHFGGFLTLLIFLVWPVWLLIAWSESRDETIAAPIEFESEVRPRAVTASLIVAAAVSSIVYQWLQHHHLDQTAALFIGIPVLLSLLVVFRVSPRSATGVACKAMTIGLLLSMMFLWEGALCVAMSAPLFYAIAVLVGTAVDLARRKGASQSTLSCLTVLVLVPMSLEGVTEKTSFNRDEWVTETRLVHAPAAEVSRAILAPPRFDRPLPLYLRAGFPRATHMRIEQSATGSRWIITVRGGEMKLNGMEPRTGTLVLQLEEARAGSMHWRAISDDSHMTHFLRWREARVGWQPVAEDVTRVTWSLRYDRGLDPAWYFGPWERYAARLAAGYLIDSVATP